ncbi:alpha/beta hydrolase [Ancylobacter sonchi]|uniref:alpha/beta hydrolase n=1 Tax=Ancylobacter sonchi TaxID=1937790 RepID=UPI001BD53E4E|nr:alpha/beta hydrolase [Ancylobacter sonchi]MBS7537034.1 alpha/beta hydrolase [Ancylobacter sonchi]
MHSWRRLVLLAALAFPLAHASTAANAHSRPKTSTVPERTDTRVYLMRGLFGVFSLGMDDLAGKLRAVGYSAEIFAWDQWQQVQALAAQRYAAGGPGTVVVIGHSLGANSVFSVADGLQRRKIPVYLAVTFDATKPQPVPFNVANFVNVWARNGFGTPVQALPGYPGNLQNFDLSGKPGADHQNIDRLDQFHQLILAQLNELTNQ